MVRASRAASAWVAATSSGSTIWRRSVADSASMREAPSRRPRPSAALSPSPSVSPLDMIGKAERFLRDMRFGKPPRRMRGWRPARPKALAAAACRSPRQKASKISSKRSQSECVAQNSARSAGLSDVGAQRGGRREHGERIAGFGKADAEAVVAQRTRETGEPARAPRRPTAFRRHRRTRGCRRCASRLRCGTAAV